MPVQHSGSAWHLMRPRGRLLMADYVTGKKLQWLYLKPDDPTLFPPGSLPTNVCASTNNYIDESITATGSKKKNPSIRPSVLIHSVCTSASLEATWCQITQRQPDDAAQRLVPLVARLNCISKRSGLQPVRLHTILTHSCVQIFIFSIILAICVRREFDWTETDAPDASSIIPVFSSLFPRAQVELPIDRLITYLFVHFKSRL